MRVLIVSEGKHECSGALETLIRRLRSNDDHAQFETDRVSNPNIRAHHGQGKGYFKRAVRWMKEAKNRGCDALVLLIDQDNRPERKQQFDEAQVSALVEIKRAIGVAVQTFDAWILADEQALSRVLEYTVHRQPDPETILHPKTNCSELLNNSSQNMSQAEMYLAVASVTNIEVLEARCQRGFSFFAQRVREL